MAGEFPGSGVRLFVLEGYFFQLFFWLLAFGFWLLAPSVSGLYLLHFVAKISDLRAICCSLEPICMLIWLLAPGSFGFWLLISDLLAICCSFACSFGFWLLAPGSFGFWLLISDLRAICCSFACSFGFWLLAPGLFGFWL